MADEKPQERDVLVQDIFPLLSETGRLHVDNAVNVLRIQQLEMFNRGLSIALQQANEKLSELEEQKTGGFADNEELKPVPEE